MIKFWTRLQAPARGVAARGLAVLGVALGALLFGPAAYAAESGASKYGPQPWQFNLQPPASPIEHTIHSFDNALMIVMGLIVILVIGLLAYVVIRFRASVHPVPSKTSHNTLIEILWTLLPILILVVIAVPSFKLLYAEADVPANAMTIKVTGHQWYWTYEYPAEGKLTFDSLIVRGKDLKPGQPRLLQVDNQLVVPVNTNIRILVTSTDVLHAWYVPALGVQKEAVPGRWNETWFRADKTGIFYGQCAELCGLNHGFMPIDVRVVSKADFVKWVAEAKKKFASNAVLPRVRVALNTRTAAE